MAANSSRRHPDDITHHLLRAFGALVGVSVLAVVVWLLTDSQAATSIEPMHTELHRVESPWANASLAPKTFGCGKSLESHGFCGESSFRIFSAPAVSSAASLT